MDGEREREGEAELLPSSLINSQGSAQQAHHVIINHPLGFSVRREAAAVATNSN